MLSLYVGWEVMLDAWCPRCCQRLSLCTASHFPTVVRYLVWFLIFMLPEGFPSLGSSHLGPLGSPLGVSTVFVCVNTCISYMIIDQTSMLQTNPIHIRFICQTFPKLFGTISSICPKHVQYMSNIRPVNTCVKHVQTIDDTCLQHV